MSQVDASRDAQQAAGLKRIPFASSPEEVERIVDVDGGVVLTGMLSRDEVRAVNDELDIVMGPLQQGNFGAGEDNFLAALFGSRTKRLQHCVKYSQTYREAFLGKPSLAEFVSAILGGRPGSHSLFSSQAIEIFPGEKPQELHRDGGGFLKALGINGPDSPHILVNTLLALTDVTEENGATRVIPGSHRWNDFSDMGAPEQTIPATMQAGDILLYNGKMCHGGGANTTEDESRRVIATSWSLGLLTPEEAWPFVISIDEVRTYPRQLQAFLGFHSVTYRGEEPGFLWRADMRPLEDYLGL